MYHSDYKIRVNKKGILNHQYTIISIVKINDYEEYFRIAICTSLLDDFFQQLNERFNNKKELITNLQNVINKY